MGCHAVRESVMPRSFLGKSTPSGHSRSGFRVYRFENMFNLFNGLVCGLNCWKKAGTAFTKLQVLAGLAYSEKMQTISNHHILETIRCTKDSSSALPQYPDTMRLPASWGNLRHPALCPPQRHASKPSPG